MHSTTTSFGTRGRWRRRAVCTTPAACTSRWRRAAASGGASSTATPARRSACRWSYPDTSLKAARERRDEARRLVASGVDPSHVRQAEKIRVLRAAEHRFEAVARAWIEHQQAAWTAETKARVLDSLVADMFNAIGKMPITDIKPRHVATAVKAIEARGASDTAGRVLQRVRAVFRYAVVHVYIEANPIQDLLRSELLRSRPVVQGHSRRRTRHS